MYASLLTFKTAPGKRTEAEGLADAMNPVLKGMKGLKTVVYIVDSDNNEYGSFSTWETKEDLGAAINSIQPKLQELLGPIAIEPPVRKIYEVYEPKT
ncbi:MAG: hypothetical protein KAS25_02765 [Dehalococcoidales bacterium]|nr:hypothetical protein [Dehalococcoidales bacterium]